MGRLMFSLAVILGASCLLLESTVWKHGKSEPEPFYTDLADAELRLRDAASKKILLEVSLLRAIEARNALSLDTVLKQLNRQRCPCDCMLSVAKCRNTHGCSLSLEAARRAVEAARKK